MTTIDRTSNLIFRNGHLIGRAVPRFEQPPFGGMPGDLVMVYQILDRQGYCYGFASTGHGPSHFETVDGRANLIPCYMDQLTPDGEMLTRAKQRRDMAGFQVQLCRRQWSKMRRDHRNGFQASAESRARLFQTYRRAQAERRRFAARVMEQGAADVMALAGAVAAAQMIDTMFRGVGL